MKHYPHNILKLKVLVLFVFVFTISSCDNDEDAFNPLLASIEIPEEFLSSTSKVFLLASDKAGEVIEFAEVKNGEVTELKSDSYKESTFTLSFVEVYTASGSAYKDLYGISYHNLKKGTKIILTDDDLEDETFINYTAQNFDVATASRYVVASNSDYSYVYPDDLSGNLYFTKGGTRTFIIKYDQDNVAAGFMFPTITFAAGTNAIINLSENFTTLQSETVTFTDPAYIGVAVYGRPDANLYDQQYLVSQDNGYDEPLTVKYPGTTFPAYSSESYAEGDDYYYEAYNKSQRSDFAMLDVNATLNITGPTIVYSLTGDGSIASFDFEMEGNDFEYFDWDLYAPVGSNQSVTIPKLPSEITTAFITFNYEAWEAEEEVSVMEIENIDSIDEYFRADMSSVDYRSLNSKYLGLYMGSGVAREARMKLVKEKKHQTAFGSFKAQFEKDRTRK